MRATSITTRQFRTAAAYASGAAQWQIGKHHGISQQAVSRRIKRFESKLTPDQLRRYQRNCRRRYGRALSTDGRRPKIRSIKVSF